MCGFVQGGVNTIWRLVVWGAALGILLAGKEVASWTNFCQFWLLGHIWMSTATSPYPGLEPGDDLCRALEAGHRFHQKKQQVYYFQLFQWVSLFSNLFLKNHWVLFVFIFAGWRGQIRPLKSCEYHYIADYQPNELHWSDSSVSFIFYRHFTLWSVQFYNFLCTISNRSHLQLCCDARLLACWTWSETFLRWARWEDCLCIDWWQQRGRSYPCWWCCCPLWWWSCCLLRWLPSATEGDLVKEVKLCADKCERWVADDIWCQAYLQLSAEEPQPCPTTFTLPRYY